MLPDALEWVLEMLGFNWPTADEDKLRESAQQWRNFASGVEELQQRGVTAAGNVVSQNSGDSIDGFNTTWEKFNGGSGSGYFADARTAAETIAVALDVAAGLVIGMKVAVIAQLAILAAEIIAAQAAAPFTFGLSEIGVAAATAATRAIVRKIIKEAAKQVLDAALETAKEPAVSALQAMISDVIAQSVNMSFGAQNGFDVGRTVNKGAEEGVNALKNSGQTFTEALRDGAGAKAGHHVRNGLESAAGHNSGGDSAGGSGHESTGGGSGGGNTSSGSGTSGGGQSSSGGNHSPSSGSNSPSDGGSSSPGGSGSPSGGDGSPSTGGTSAGGSSAGGTSAGASSAGGGATASGGSSSADHSTPTNNPSTAPNSSPHGGSSPADGGSSSSAGGNGHSPDGGNSPRPAHSATPPQSQLTPFDAGYREAQTASPTPDASSSATSSPSSPDSSARPNTDTPTSHDTSNNGSNTDTSTNAAPRPDSETSPRSDTDAPPRPHTESTADTGTRTDTDSRPDTASAPAPTPAHADSPSPNPSPNPAAPTPEHHSNGISDPSGGSGDTGDTGGVGNTGGSATNSGNDGTTDTGTHTRPQPQHAPSPAPDPSPSPSPSPTPSPTPDHSGTQHDDGNSSNGGGSRTSMPTGGGVASGGSAPHAAPSGHGYSGPSSSGAPHQPDPNRPQDDGPVTVHTESATLAPPPPGVAQPSHAGGDTPGSAGTPPPSTQQSPQPGVVMGGGTMPTGVPAGTPAGGSPSATTPPRSTAPSSPAGNAGAPPRGTPTRDPRNPTAADQSSRPRPTPARSTAQPPRTERPHGEQPSPRPSRPAQQSPHTNDAPPSPTTPDHNSQSPNTKHDPKPDSDSKPENDSKPDSESHPKDDQAPDNKDDTSHTPDPSDVPDASDAPDTSDATATPDDRPSLDEIRSGIQESPGGLLPPDTVDQHALENAVPRNDDGSPQRFPDPTAGWAQLQNDGGTNVPGRSNNCADCSRSFLETWYGNPQVSAPRTPDQTPDGTPDHWSPESKANENIIDWAGAPHSYAGTSPDGHHAIAQELLKAGPGSAAIVQVNWADGGGHAFNAVNHNGKIVWVDTQSGEVSHHPINTEGATDVFHIPLDADRTPLHPAPDASNGSGATDSHHNSDGTDPDHTAHADQSPPAANGSHDTGVGTASHDAPSPDHGKDERPSAADPAALKRKASEQPSPDGESVSSTPESGSDAHRRTRIKVDGEGQPGQQSGNDPHTDTPSPPQTTLGSLPDHMDALGLDDHRMDVDDDHTQQHSPPQQAPQPQGTNTGSGTAEHPTSGPPHGKTDSKTDGKTDGKEPYSDPRDRGTSDTAKQEKEGKHTLDAEKKDSKEYGKVPDKLQAQLRNDRDVHRIPLDRVHDRLTGWADDGSLARALRASSGHPQTNDPDAGKGPQKFTQSDLEKRLPGFKDLDRGEKLAVVSSLTRLSVGFHEQHGVGSNPVDVDKPYRPPNEPDAKDGTTDSAAKNSDESLGVRGHRNSGNKYLDKLKHDGPMPESLKQNSPDFTDRNYAVLEVEGPPPARETHYVADSSVPVGEKYVSGRHSEKHLMEWLNRANQEGAQYSAKALYTEREPCGNGQGHAKCSNVLREMTPKDTKVYYSTTYRTDPEDVKAKKQLDTEKKKLKKEFDKKPIVGVQKEINDRLDRREGKSAHWIAAEKDKIDKLSEAEQRKKLSDMIDAEFTKRKNGMTTPEKQAMVREMDRHIAHLDSTWKKIQPSLL
ncbi:toxin glutamine deamidase domain-containing protein [Streptomyces noursei]|uniref:toxin glutamine deamidase domain-containing protein n=1 Tax=Streptomyces noursei TaxID=1971 RepID=UPI002155E1D5|nr:toxin glutamine deamidase domain-containing protein [Streptomyces noursei]